MPILQVNDTELYFYLRRSTKAKRLHIRLIGERFEVVAPNRVSNTAILAFVWSSRPWMLKQKVSQERAASMHSLFAWPQAWVSGERLPYRAQSYWLNIKFSTQAHIQLQQNNLRISLPCHQICYEQMAHHVKKQILNWYRQEASEAIQKSLAHFCPLLGRWPTSVQLKEQKTRWGSCGVNRKIYINWLLILAPPGVLEYVVLHELCHLFHRHHGKQFWGKVAKYLPQYREYDRWLTKHGRALLQICS